MPSQKRLGKATTKGISPIQQSFQNFTKDPLATFESESEFENLGCFQDPGPEEEDIARELAM